MRRIVSKLRIMVGLLAVASAAPLFAQTGAPVSLTIEQAVAEAVANNPAIAAQRLGLSVADTSVITAGLKPNPVLSLSTDHLDLLGTGFSEANGAGPSEHALRVDLPLERGGKRELRIDNAGYERKIADARLNDSVRRLKLDVTVACIDLIEAKAKLQLANENLQALEKLVSFNETRLKGGAIAPLELTRSRVAMLQFRSEVRTAELTLTTARTKLAVLLGRRPGELLDVSDPLKVPLPSATPTLEQLNSAALISRPDLQSLKLEEARSQADLKLQIAEGKVDYTVGMEYRRQQGVNGEGNSLGFFFSAPLPVYNRNQGEIARATSEGAHIRKNIEAATADVEGDVTGAYQEYLSAREMVTEIERDLLQPSTEARDTTAYVYQTGASLLVDVLDAQRAFNDTMSAYYEAQADYRRAESRLASAIGRETIQ